MLKISDRLKNIASLIQDNSNVLDIGCDHALLDIYLIKNKKDIKVIVSDILESALNQAKNNIRKYKLESLIQTRLGNGLNVINKDDNIDTVVISGMGANTIISILYNNKLKLKKINKLIIQSNNYIPLVRKKICKLGYYIKDEKLVFDNKKLYTILSFEKGHQHYSNNQYLLGPILLQKNEKIYQDMIKNEIKRNTLLLKIIPKKHFLKRYQIRKYLNILINELKNPLII